MRVTYISLLLACYVVVSAQPITLQRKERILKIHNEYRAEVGSVPLIWSEELANEAHVWATYLASNDLFEHSTAQERNYTGENLWQGTKGFYAISTMIEDWTSERKYYRYERMKSSNRSNKKETGHYTQMVWSNTKKIGCAIAHNVKSETLVCRYSPAGNIIGQYPY